MRLSKVPFVQPIWYQELSHLLIRCYKEDYLVTQIHIDIDWVPITTSSKSTVLIDPEFIMDREVDLVTNSHKDQYQTTSLTLRECLNRLQTVRLKIYKFLDLLRDILKNIQTVISNNQATCIGKSWLLKIERLLLITLLVICLMQEKISNRRWFRSSQSVILSMDKE